MAPLAAVLISCSAFVAWVSGAGRLYRAIWYYLGVPQFRFPFLDTQAVVAAMDCHRRGIDVFKTNPCDALDRPHVYSPLWLWIGDRLPVETAWTPIIGLVLCLLFLATLFALPAPRTWPAALCMVLATTSWSVSYAVERGNNDLVIFILVLTAALLVQRGWQSRALAYSLVMFGALLKFYPLVGMVVLARERLRIFIAAVALSILTVVVFGVVAYPEMTRILVNIPGLDHFSWDMFGAAALPGVLGEALGLPPVIVRVAKLVMLLCSACIALRLALAVDMSRRLAALTAAETVFLLTGSALICGCFYSGPNVGYRGVHLLLALPGLIVARGAGRDGLRFAFSMAIAAAVFVMWLGLEVTTAHFFERRLSWEEDTVNRVFSLLWLLQQIAWWWLATILLSVAAAIVIRSSPISALLGTRRLWPTMLVDGVLAESGSPGRTGSGAALVTRARPR